MIRPRIMIPSRLRSLLVLSLLVTSPLFAQEAYPEEGVSSDAPEWIVGTFERWAKKHTGEASDWLKQQPASTNRDQMIVKLTDQLGKWDPAGALEWAEEIGDEKLRSKTVEKVGSLDL